MGAAEIIFQRPIAFHRSFVALGAGVTGALLLSQAVYWQERTTDASGWWWKTKEEWTKETGLSRHEQDGARAQLEKLCVIEVVLRGNPARLHYRVNKERILELISKGGRAAKKATKPVSRKPAIKKAENQPTRTPKSGQLDRLKAANKFATKRPARSPESRQQVRVKAANTEAGIRPTNIRKTTSVTTAETTAETTVIAAGASQPPSAADAFDPAQEVEPPPMLVKTAAGVREIPGKLRYPGPDTKTHKAWVAYALSYHKRYGSWPVWNRSQAGKISNFIERVGFDNAPIVASFYVKQVNEHGVVLNMHPLGMLLASAEKWLAQAETGRMVTRESARQADNTQTNMNAAQSAGDRLYAAMGGKNDA